MSSKIVMVIIKPLISANIDFRLSAKNSLSRLLFKIMEKRVWKSWFDALLKLFSNPLLTEIKLNLRLLLRKLALKECEGL